MIRYGDKITSIAVEEAKGRLIEREGRRNKVYRDSLGRLTVGIGHLVTPADNLKLGDVISDEEADHFFCNDIRYALRAAQIQASDLGIICSKLLAALISVNFQLGPKWHLPKRNGGKGFVQTYDLIKRRKYDQAIENLKGSLWYSQTPKRVEDFIEAIKYLKKLTNQ